MVAFFKILGVPTTRQNLGVGAQKFVRCAKIYLSVPKIFQCLVIIANCQHKRLKRGVSEVVKKLGTVN